jgi:hypothetical protein
MLGQRTNGQHRAALASPSETDTRTAMIHESWKWRHKSDRHKQED